MDFIKIALWLGEHNDLVYLILGGIAGLLFGHFTKKKKFPGRNGNRELKYELRTRPNVLNIILFAIIVIFSLTLSKVNNSYTIMPDVVNLTYEEASARLHAAGLSCTENYGRYGDVVTAISPDTDYVRSGSMIELTLGRQKAEGSADDNGSTTPFETIMPDVYMVQEQAALTYLRVAGFNDIEILPQYTDTTVAGYVLSSEPFAGEPVNFTDKITLYVSVNEVR